MVPAVPPALDRLVQRCLAKEPDERWQSAADLARELSWIAEGGAPAGETAPATARRGSARMAWSVAGVLAIVAIVFGSIALRPPATSSRDPIRFEIPAPEGTLLRTMYEAAAPPAVSPDGRHVVFGVMSAGDNRLWLRTLNAQPRPLPGTENGNRPFWSPDSRSIGFFTTNELQRIDIAGGPPLTVCTANAGRGGSWNHEGTIVLSPISDSGLFRVAADGGEPQPVTELGTSPLESSHRYPQFLPEMDFEKGSEPRPLIESSHHNTLPAISPDGHWLAYSSDESGRPEVYVTRFPSLEGKWQVSGTGSLDPLWDVDGKTLFYRSTSHTVMSVPVTIAGSQIQFGTESKLFDLYSFLDIEESVFDLSPDGKHFVASVIPEERMRAPITVVVDWAAALAD